MAKPPRRLAFWDLSFRFLRYSTKDPAREGINCASRQFGAGVMRESGMVSVIIPSGLSIEKDISALKQLINRIVAVPEIGPRSTMAGSLKIPPAGV